MPRQDIFTFIHNGLRSMIYEQGKSLMLTDFSDKSLSENLARLEHTLTKLEDHGRHEEQFVFPTIVEQTPKLVNDFMDQHRNIDLKIKTVHETMEDVRKTDILDERIQLGLKLNRDYNNLAAYYLDHMNMEETELMPATWEHLTDEEIGSIRSNIQRNIPPEAYAEQLTWSLGATNNGELIGLFKGLKATAPQPVVENVIKIAQKALPQQRWEYIKDSADL